MDYEFDSPGNDVANLANLPIEILQPILSSLPKQDVKSVRLASRLLATKATPLLFRNVRISSLKADRDAFLNIGNAEHLARHVCVIVWEELNGDHDRLDSEIWGTDPRVFPEDQWPLFNDIMAQARDLFWLTVHDRKLPQEALKTFLLLFIDAIVRMPNLHTLASRPMHDERELQAASSGYPITARVIKRLIQHDKEKCLFNLGFISTLMPTLQFMAEQGKRVTRLHLAEEGTTTNNTLPCLSKDHADAFANLERLDLCISDPPLGWVDFDGLMDCLGAATNLSYLHISQAGVCKEEVDSVRLLCLFPTFPRLTEVHLDDIALDAMPLEMDPPPGVEPSEPASALTTFVQQHAETLRKLRITSSYVTRKMLLSLSKLNSLQLERFVIVGTEDDDEHGCWPTSEEAILSFVNKPVDGVERYSLDVRPDEEETICTHPAVWDIDEWPSVAVFETRRRGWRARGYEPREVMALDEQVGERRDEDGFTHELGLCREYDPATGLWVDRDGVWYDPRTDEEIMEPERRSYETEQEGEHSPWAVKNERGWDWGLGLWRNLGSNGRQMLYKFAVDRIDSHEVVMDRIDDALSDDGLEVDMHPFYEQEDDDHLMRQLTSPRWQWGRDSDGRIWYWEVFGNNGFGYATEMWHFRHRNGEEAYGEEPLDFWTDWEGSEAGDAAEATPFGWRFRAFVKNWYFQEHTGVDLPSREEIGQLYGEPVLWRENEEQFAIEAVRIPDDFDMDTTLIDLEQERRLGPAV